MVIVWLRCEYCVRIVGLFCYVAIIM